MGAKLGKYLKISSFLCRKEIFLTVK